MRIIALLIFTLAVPASAHEFWIGPVDYQPKNDQQIVANIINGENFKGAPQVYIPQRFELFKLIRQNQTVPVKARIGDNPALNQQNLGDGLHIAVYQSVLNSLTYRSFEKFKKFADHKGFVNIEQRHRSRRLGESNFREIYTRMSKSLIGVGSGTGADRRIGLETEFVALDNPYTLMVDHGLRAQLFYGEAVRPHAQIELFEKAIDGKVVVTIHQTDDAGIVHLNVKPGHVYMVDAVVLREPDAELVKSKQAAWETLWANLTFRIPD